ncbi:MAG: hypothetical protein ACRC54_00940 [Fusobacteriaceae bacterium]
MEEVIKNLIKLNFMGIVVAVTAFLVGLKFPDFDFKLKLQHRNILTHSPFLVFIFLYYYMKEPVEITRYFIIGFSLAIGIHLIFDLFPKGWGGGALLKIPIVRLQCNPILTQNLLKIFIIISLGISIKYTREVTEFLLILFLGTFTILKHMKKEKKLIRPLFLYLIFFAFLGSFKYESVHTYVVKNLYIGIEMVHNIIK